MGGNKQKGSSSSSSTLPSSSFTSDLFGPSESSLPSSSSDGFFGPIFSASSKPKPFGREFVAYEPPGKDSTNQLVSHTKHGGQDAKRWKSHGTNQSGPDYQEQPQVQPCHLSSSLYYGGQDVYSQPPNNIQASSYSTNKKEGESESGSPHRGNWWQGSLYY